LVAVNPATLAPRAGRAASDLLVLLAALALAGVLILLVPVIPVYRFFAGWKLAVAVTAVVVLAAAPSARVVAGAEPPRSGGAVWAGCAAAFACALAAVALTAQSFHPVNIARALPNTLPYLPLQLVAAAVMAAAVVVAARASRGADRGPAVRLVWTVLVPVALLDLAVTAVALAW
jgi:hypothetical protein